MKYFISIIITAFLKITCFAQADCNYTFSGKVLNADDNLPAAYVVVALEETNFKTITDSLGKFSFQNLCHQSYHLTVKGIGYQSFRHQYHIHKNITETILLHSDTCLLESVTISAKIEQQPIGNQILELNNEQLELNRGKTLGEMLKELPGVNAYQAGPNVFKPVIQGQYGNRVMILNNGIRLEGQNWGSDHAPEIDPFTANQIAVVKGASAVQYGADAQGGAILITPANLRNEKGWDANFNTMYGSNNRQMTVAGMLNFVPKIVKGFSGRVQFSAEKGGNYKTPNYYLNNTGREQYSAAWAAKYTKEKWGLNAYYSIFNNKNGIFSGAHLHSISDVENIILNGNPTYKNATFNYNINRPYQKVLHELMKGDLYYNFNAKNKINLLISRQFNKREEYDIDRPLSDIINGIDKATVNFGLTTYQSQISINSKINTINQNIGLGILNQINTLNTNNVRLFLPFYNQNYYYAYLIEKIRIKRWLMEAGTRVENRVQNTERYGIEENKNYWYNSSSLGVTFYKTDHLNFSINAAYSSRPPAINEMYADGLHQGDGTFIKGNKNLNTEQNLNNQFNINYQNKNTFINISVYHNYFFNYIYSQPSGEILTTIRGTYPVFNFTQTKANFKGIDFQANQNIFKQFEMSMQGSLLNAYDISRQDFLPFIPANKITIKLKYHLKNSQNRKETFIAIGHEYVFKQNRVPQKSSYENSNTSLIFNNLIKYGDYMAPPNAYHLFKFEAMTQLNLAKQKMIAGVVVNNLFNTVYRDYLNKFRYYTDETGINIQLKIKYLIN